MIRFEQKGNFKKLDRYFKRINNATKNIDLEQFGERGVAALSSATPVATGLAAKSWYYKIERTKDSATIKFCNSDIENGAPIAIILQYGHATKNGGWVEGRDYINPAIQPIFDELAKNAWEEVTKQ